MASTIASMKKSKKSRQKLSGEDSEISESRNPQSNLPVDKKPKVVCLEEYYNFREFNNAFMTNVMMERIARELIEWAESNQNAFKIKQFITLKGVTEKLWKNWIHKYPVLGEAHDHAKTILGNKREVASLKREIDGSQNALMMPHYDSDWKEMIEWRESLKKKENLNDGPQIVVLEKMPDSPLVPKKKDDVDEN